ncbi:MAG: Coenzyme F420 hydrogenase/dehydrogenase, beta subunit C-terminal domain [Methanobacteriaceae archaeon]
MVKVNDMFYAWASDNEILEKGECGGAVSSFLKYLLEEKIVDGVLSVKKGSDIYDAVPTLITDPEDVIGSAGSLHCGTLNMAKTIQKYLNGAKDIKIAVTVKPCDARTIVELMKRKQIKEDNILMVGINCGGTMPPVKAREMISKFYDVDPDEVVKEEIAKGNLIIETKNDGEKEISIDTLEDEGYGRRTNCRRCDVNIPIMADLAFGNWGVIGPLAGKATFVEIFSQKGADAFDSAVSSGNIKTKAPEKKGIEIRANIDNIMVKLAKKWQNADFEESDLLITIDNYMDQLNKCIKCFGCRESCPICWCNECSLESDSPEWVSKGELPPSPMFHWVRLMHIVDSCTNCGQCEEVCPAEIPLSKIYHEINLKLQEEFGYYSGFDVNQKPPLSVIDKSPADE